MRLRIGLLLLLVTGLSTLSSSAGEIQPTEWYVYGNQIIPERPRS